MSGEKVDSLISGYSDVGSCQWPRDSHTKLPKHGKVNNITPFIVPEYKASVTDDEDEDEDEALIKLN